MDRWSEFFWGERRKRCRNERMGTLRGRGGTQKKINGGAGKGMLSERGRTDMEENEKCTSRREGERTRKGGGKTDAAVRRVKVKRRNDCRS